MRQFLEIFELTTDQPEKFAVVAIDPSRPTDTGCAGTILKLTLTRDDAEQWLEDLQS